MHKFQINFINCKEMNKHCRDWFPLYLSNGSFQNLDIHDY